MTVADTFKHHIDSRARELLDRLADDLEDDTLMTTQETARWLNVSTQFLEIGRTQGYGPPATMLAPKIIRLAVEMMALRMMMASDEFTTARVVAQPTPSLPPNVDSPQYPLTMGMAAP